MLHIPKTEREIELARSAARDAGNESMKKGKRTAWNRDDYNTAVAVFNKLSKMRPFNQ